MSHSWCKVHNIMLKKYHNDPKLYRLRVIHNLEAGDEDTVEEKDNVSSGEKKTNSRLTVEQ